MPPNQQYPGAPQPQQPQQTPNGQYQVLPPLPVAPNNGHSGHNPYEFIVNPESPRKTPGKLFGGNKFAMQIAVILGGAIVLIAVAAIAISALSPKSPVAAVTAIVQRQQEIIRIATAADQNVVGQDTKNFVANVDAAVASDQQQALSYLADHGTKKLKPKVLAMDQSADTDALLANATATNTYDTVSVQVLTNELQTYQRLIKTTFDQTTSKTLKDQLQHSFTASGVLLEQAKAIGS